VVISHYHYTIAKKKVLERFHVHFINLISCDHRLNQVFSSELVVQVLCGRIHAIAVLRDLQTGDEPETQPSL
jgi:hypothetical protein